MSLAKPQTITIQTIDRRHIYIGWNAPTCVVDYYEIERQEFGTGQWKKLVSGAWVDSGTPDQITNTHYLDEDVTITKTYQYRVRGYEASQGYSDYSYSGALGIDSDTKVGYMFGNYAVPSGEWGVAGTADDLRYAYMFGIELTATNGQKFPDAALESWMRSAVEDFESYLGIIIRRRRFVTQPSGLTRQKYWSENCDYTDEDDPYPFRPDVWREQFGQLKLLNYPVISLARAKLYTETDAELINLLGNEWIRLDKQSGLISFFPKIGIETFGPFVQGSQYLRTLYKVGYPHGFKFDYDAGYENSDFIPEGLRETMMKWAAVKCLNSIGDGLLAGFSSSSISLDGLSESFSSTQSATSAYFGARIHQYMDEIKEWLKINRYKFNNMPLGFI